MIGCGDVTEEKNGLFNHIQSFFFGCKNPAKGFSLRYFFTPASTYVYLIAVSAVLNGMERTFSNTAAAVFTYVFVNLNLPINHLCHFVWTGSLNGTFLAAFTYICIDVWNSLSNNSYIIQVWFHTVIRTATHCNLKFMRKCNLPVAFIKTSVNFF